MSIDWSKAPEGAQFWCEGEWFKKEASVWFCAGIEPSSLWSLVSYQSPENFSWWGSAIDRPSAWTGEGLPPAGTACEVKGCMSHYLQWNKVTVFAVRGKTVFFDMEDGRWGQTESHEFRPIRTPEQIAAEERENGIDAILTAYTYTVGPCTHKLARSQAERLYDAGIRKQVAP